MPRPALRRIVAFMLAAGLLATAANASAASFTYRGQLDDRGVAANGRYDLRLSPWLDPSRPIPAAAPMGFPGVEVIDGRFTLSFDLPVGSGQAVWLDLEVADAGGVHFTPIPGRIEATAAPLIGACWSSTGDSGTNPATNFIGTIDAQPFVVRTGNARSLRIEPSSILLGGLPITTNTIAGSRANSVTDGVRGATIAGGGIPLGNSDPDFPFEAPNRVTDHYGTVSGGFGNVAGDSAGTTSDRFAATVGGGFDNIASGPKSTVGGGQRNHASGSDSTIGGGQGNNATDTYGTVAGGFSNTASGNFSTIGGGFGNVTIGSSATVGGGSENCAGGSFSWAGGLRAKVRPGADPDFAGACSGLTYPGGLGDVGTFVWADRQNENFVSTGSNQFLVRASGGFGFNTNSIPSGRLINTSTGAFLTTGGTWTNASSRALKTAFEAIDAGDVLARLLALPLTRWQYRESPAEGMHLGPVAEDFHAAFGLGADGQAISTVDASGVALAAIQGLNAKLEAVRDGLRAQVEALGAENAALRARLDRLEALIGDRAAEER